MTVNTIAGLLLPESNSTVSPLPATPPRGPVPLARIARTLAGRHGLWRSLLRIDPERRWYTRVAGGEGWEAWLIGWAPGQGTGLHDHGASAGAFTVLTGALVETTPIRGAAGTAALTSRTLAAGAVRSFGPDHVHDVTAPAHAPAASLHVYGPSLSLMNWYEYDPATGLSLVRTETEGDDW